MRTLTLLDRILDQAERALQTCTPGATRTGQPSPADTVAESPLTPDQRTLAGRLMRVNHTGEVCAQALYNGQSLTARHAAVAEQMQEAAAEEETHLEWCEQRLHELGARTSPLNPAYYAASFALGAFAGGLGDRWSLGFVAATEQEVEGHLADHLERLPPADERSRVVIARMLQDEADHAAAALDAGGVRFPTPVRRIMAGVSGLMTRVVYYG